MDDIVRNANAGQETLWIYTTSLMHINGGNFYISEIYRYYAEHIMKKSTANRILNMDAERALRSTNPRFVQAVAVRAIELDRHDLLDRLGERVYYLTEGYLKNNSAAEKIKRLFYP